MADYYVIPTNIGEAKMANALALGIPLAITELALGDGEGEGARGTPIPNPEATALVSERRRAPLNSFSVDPENSNVLIAEQVIPESAGGWWIREMGLFDEDGDLIFVCNTPPTYKPQLAEGSGRTQVVRMASVVSDTEAVTLKVDPSVVLATRQYAEKITSDLEEELDLALKSRAIYANTISDLQSMDDSGFYNGQEALVRGVPFTYDGAAWVPTFGYVTPSVYGAPEGSDAFDEIQQTLDTGYNVVFDKELQSSACLNVSNPDVSIEFINAGKILFTGSETFNGILTVESGATNCNIRNPRIEKEGDQATAIIGIEVFANDCVISGPKTNIKNCRYCILGRGVAERTRVKSGIYSPGAGGTSVAINGDYGKVTGTFCPDFGDTGIIFVGSKGSLAANNTLFAREAGSTMGIGVEEASEACIVSTNTIYGNSTGSNGLQKGIRVDNNGTNLYPKNNKVVNNTVIGCRTYALEVIDTNNTENMTGNELRGNTVVGNGITNSAIRVTGAQETFVEHNKLDGCGLGITAAAPVPYMDVKDNRCSNMSTVGYSLNAILSGEVSGNRCKSSAKNYTVDNLSDGVIFKGNHDLEGKQQNGERIAISYVDTVGAGMENDWCAINVPPKTQFRILLHESFKNLSSSADVNIKLTGAVTADLSGVVYGSETNPVLIYENTGSTSVGIAVRLENIDTVTRTINAKLIYSLQGGDI